MKLSKVVCGIMVCIFTQCGLWKEYVLFRVVIGVGVLIVVIDDS